MGVFKGPLGFEEGLDEVLSGLQDGTGSAIRAEPRSSMDFLHWALYLRGTWEPTQATSALKMCTFFISGKQSPHADGIMCLRQIKVISHGPTR